MRFLKDHALCGQDGGQPRFVVADLASQLEPLLTGLFGAFAKPESGENEYVMKGVMRVITFVGKDVRSPLLAGCTVCPARSLCMP